MDNQDKITQISCQAPYFKKLFMDRWGLLDYYDSKLPCFFFGVVDQLNVINNHRGLKIVLSLGFSEERFVKRLNGDENLHFIESPFFKTPNNIKNTSQIKIETKDYSIYEPNPLGDCVYVHLGRPDRKNTFRIGEIEKIAKKIPFEALIGYTNEGGPTYLSPEEHKMKYYDRSFVSINLSPGAGQTTLRELGKMGRKTITNKSDKYDCVIRYKSISDIPKIIIEESKKIGTIQPDLMKTFPYVGEEWLRVDHWKK